MIKKLRECIFLIENVELLEKIMIFRTKSAIVLNMILIENPFLKIFENQSKILCWWGCRFCDKEMPKVKPTNYICLVVILSDFILIKEEKNKFAYIFFLNKWLKKFFWAQKNSGEVRLWKTFVRGYSKKWGYVSSKLGTFVNFFHSFFQI